MKALFIILSFFTLASMPVHNFYSFTMKDINGNEVPLSEYKGKVVLVVNVASKCGLTPQYEGLEALYKEYKDKDFVILGFPANNFMGQEPGSDKEIKTFCSTKYNVTFPIFSKISVKGKDMHPLYKYLTKKSENGIIESSVKWNFQKFIIDKKGKVTCSFAPTVVPSDPTLKAAIDMALAE